MDNSGLDPQVVENGPLKDDKHYDSPLKNVRFQFATFYHNQRLYPSHHPEADKKIRVLSAP